MEASPHTDATSAREVAPPADLLRAENAIVFTDIVGSTDLAQTLGDAWSDTVVLHHQTVRRFFDDHGGFEAGNRGDGFLYLFSDLDEAVAAAVVTQRALTNDLRDVGPLGIRIGIHWGPVGFSAGVGFFGISLHRGARIADTGGAGQVLMSQPVASQIGPRLAAGTELIDHGEFWLKDLRRAERLIELTIDGQQPRAPSAHGVATRDLPEFPADFVGRRDLLDAVLASVRSEPGAITTLCGPGGVGKTRLAIEVLRRTVDRPAFFVDLSHAEETSHLVPALARTIGLDPNATDVLEQMAVRLHGDRALVVVDNLEQIIDCAPELSSLARAAPAATFLATSRLPLRVTGERVIEVEPLPTDAEVPDDIRPCNAMFIQVAAIARPTAAEQQTVAHVCRLLDGLPLAVELAAGRVDLLGLDQVASQLENSTELLVSGRRDSPERHQTLTSTVLWSYRLLSAEGQVLFRELSQFPAGATIDTLTAISTLDAPGIATGCAELVEHRLARRTQTSAGNRFGMLRVIREVAAGELERADELSAVRTKVATHLRDRSRQSVFQLGGTSEQDTYLELVDELENFRYLFGWDDTPELIDLALASASDLLTFWWHDHLAEGVDSLRRLTELPAAATSRHYPRALVSSSILATYGGNPGESMRLAEQAVQAARARPRPGSTLCAALQQLAISEAAQGHGQRALDLAAEVLEVSSELPDLQRAIQLVGVGPVLLSENEVGQAEAAFMQAVSIFDSAGPSWLAAAPVARLGECALRRGNLDEADEQARAGIERWEQSPGLNGRSRAWSGLARVRWCGGDVDDARAIAKDAASVACELKSIGDLPWSLITAGAVASSDRRFEESEFLFAAATELASAYAQPILGAVRHELAPARRQAVEALRDHAPVQRSAGQAATADEVMEVVESL